MVEHLRAVAAAGDACGRAGDGACAGAGLGDREGILRQRGADLAIDHREAGQQVDIGASRRHRAQAQVERADASVNHVKHDGDDHRLACGPAGIGSVEHQRAGADTDIVDHAGKACGRRTAVADIGEDVRVPGQRGTVAAQQVVGSLHAAHVDGNLDLDLVAHRRCGIIRRGCRRHALSRCRHHLTIGHHDARQHAHKGERRGHGAKVQV